MPRKAKEARFVDERMVAHGDSTFKPREGHPKRGGRLMKTVDLAKRQERVLWGAITAGPSKSHRNPNRAIRTCPHRREPP